MAKFYVVYMKNKKDTREDQPKFYLTRELNLLNKYTQTKPNLKIEVTKNIEDSKLFDTLEEANKYIEAYNKKEVIWFIEEFEVRLRKSKADKNISEQKLNDIKKLLNDDNELVVSEDGAVYVEVDIIKGILDAE